MADRDFDKAIELYKDELSMADIAKELGVNKSAISRWIKNGKRRRLFIVATLFVLIWALHVAYSKRCNIQRNNKFEQLIMQYMYNVDVKQFASQALMRVEIATPIATVIQ